MSLKISLPMYDTPGVRSHTDGFFAALHAAVVPALRALGDGGDAEAAETLARLHPRPHRLRSDDQASAESVWDDPDLLLSQICGQPLTARLTRVGLPSLAAIATPCYTHAGCDGQPIYRGFVVVRGGAQRNS